MSLQTDLPRQVPENTATLGRMLFPVDNVYRQIGDRFDELFPDQGPFVQLYQTTGRGAIPPLLLALVTVLQMLEKVSDRAAVDWVASRIDWKYALHLPLEYPGFHFTDLSAFRQRLWEHHQERLVFDELLAKLKTLGLIQSRGKARTDSTHLLGWVERLSQLDLITESIRVALNAIAQVAAGWWEKTLPAAFREAYSQRRSSYGQKESEVADQVQQAGQDGFWLLTQIDQSAPEPVAALNEVHVLRQVLEQQFPHGPSHPPATCRPTGDAIIESPHEPEARYSKKRSKSWLGYKLQVTETCESDQVHVITDVEVTSAVANDSHALPQIQARLNDRQLLPGEQYVDRGYITGEHLVKSQAQGIDLVGPAAVNPHAAAGFQQADFQMDLQAQRAVCPAGQVSQVWSPRAGAEGEPPSIQIRFPAAPCQACRFWGVCTTSPQGRSLELNAYREALEARRAEAQTDTFKVRYRIRSGIEATLSELVRGHGMRRARFRGRAKLLLQACFTAVAANLKRVVRWWAGQHARLQAAAVVT